MAEHTSHLLFCNGCRVETRHRRLWSKSLEIINGVNSIYYNDQNIGDLDELAISDYSPKYERFEDEHSFGRKRVDEPRPFSSHLGDEEWAIYQCLGCSNLALRSQTSYFDDTKHIAYFPTREQTLANAKRFSNIPPQLNSIYKEIVGSFNSGFYSLCAAGLRSLLEGIAFYLRPEDTRRARVFPKK